MTPEKEKYEEAASQKKVDLIITVVLFALLIGACGVIIALMYENVLATVIAGVCIVWFAVKLYLTVVAAHPRAVFSGEFEGRVVDIALSYPKNEKKEATTELYIAESKTKIHLLSPLPKSCASIYKKGDRVFHIKGTLAPLILDRELESIPCPLCGRSRQNGTSAKCPICKI